MIRTYLRSFLALLFGTLLTSAANAAISVTPITWNVVGLDSNNVMVGPNRFPGGMRVCTDATPSNGNITVTWNWTTADSFINLRTGSQNPVVLSALAANSCADAYFEIEVTRNASAYNHTRRYRVDAGDSNPGLVSSPVPREIFVEKLISQNRNSVNNIQFGTTLAGLTSVAPGGAMNLVVGNTYFIRLIGGTATQGYEQLETFIGFSNTVFRVLNVDSQFPADTSPNVASPASTLYLDACRWENDPNSPNYRACLGVGKAGGAPVQITYQVQIISGGGTSESLNSLFYDFSGSSYHYNSDYSVGGRIANIIDPAGSTISKSFTPNAIPVNGTSTLSIVINNPNASAVSGYSVIDNLPSGVVVATPPSATTTGCGTPTFAPTAGATTLTFSNGTIGATSSCTFSVKVTSAAVNTYNNTTNALLIDGVTTGQTASASLMVSNAPAPPACTNGLELATWTMPTAAGTTTPPAFTFKSGRVTTAAATFTARAGTGTNTIDTTTIGSTSGVNSWSGVGWNSATGAPAFNVASFFKFQLSTNNFTNVSMQLRANPIGGGSAWASPGNNELYFRSSTDDTNYTGATFTQISRDTWNTPAAFLAAPTGGTDTYFRITAAGVSGGGGGSSAQLLLDDVVFTGCGVPEHPLLTKAFNPTTIGVNGISTLTFTLNNENNIALTGAAFTDALPAGIQVAATPAVSSTCGTWTPAPVAGNTTLTFTGGTIPARVGTTNGSCTLSVNVTATSAGARTNVSGPISTTQTGTNSGPTGSATASLNAILPPVLSKQFAPSGIIIGGVSTLTFTITNPNPSDALASVAFSDTFPVAPGAMVVASPASPTNTCSPAGTWTTTVGAGSVSLTGAGVPAGGSCTVSVNVTAPNIGTYNNTSGNVSHIVNGVTVNGNTASAALLVKTATPAISLLKQVSISASGPWFSYLAVPLNTPLFYQFTVENTGDVALVRPATPGFVTDSSVPGPNVNTTSCFAGWSNPLPVAAPGNNNHINACVVGPINAVASGVVNTGTASSPTGPSTATSVARYGITGLTLVKSAGVSVYGYAGQVISYSFLVTNSGNAILSGPVLINDNLTTNESCPALSTVGDFDNFFDPGESITCSATYTILAADLVAGTVNNIASASAGGANSPTANVTITYTADFGDLPDSGVGVGAANYRTLRADSGPSHVVIAGLFLGSLIDAETQAQQNTAADGDDSNVSDDEDGLVSVTFATVGSSCSAVTLRFNATAPNGASTILNVFVDRNGDGDFEDVAETGSTTFTGTAASGGINVVLPARATVDCFGPFTPGGIVGIRARLALASDTSAVTQANAATLQGGAVASGEVEDYSTATFGTVPVTLSNVEVKESGSELVVNFNTATEAGTLGYRVLADIGKGVQARVEIGSVASKAIDSLREQSYSVRARNPGADQVWIEESAVDGKATLYGPYKVGSSVGEIGLAKPLDWVAVNSEQRSFRAARETLLRGLSEKSAEIRVSSDGWVRITQAQLAAAGVDLSGQQANNIAVRLGSETLPARVNLADKTFGPGSTIEFFAKAVKNSLYTTTAVYRIEIGRALALAEVDARTTGLSVGPEVPAVADTLVLNNNTTYSFSSPIEDPWFSFRALRSGGAAVGVGSINFTLTDRVAPAPVAGNGAPKPSVSALLTADETLEVSFWGGLDYAGSTPDHLAVFKLNGTVLGQAQFDGFAARTQRFKLPQGSLLSGANTFTVELPNSTGYAADIVNVESVSVGYTRKLSPQADRLSVVLPETPIAALIRGGGADQLNASTFVVTGLSGAPMVAVLERAGAQSLLKTDAVSAGSLRIELAAQAGDRLSLMPIENGVLPTAAIALTDPIAGTKASYLIISHPSFIANLSPLVLAKQSQGFSVKVVDVEAIYRYYSAGVVDPAAIQLAIRRAQQQLGTTHVLLVGGDTYDYQNVLGINSVSFIPTNYRRSGPIIAFMPSDAVYADTDGNGVPNVAIGRWPVRTLAELNALLGKSLSYQNTHKALFISDRSLNGTSYASQAAPLANLLGQNWTTGQLSLDSYASGQAATARADIVSNLEGGTSLLSYYGHSAPASWSREGLVTANQVSGGLFNTVNQPFATVQLGCWGTYFVEPTSTTVAHQMLLMPKGAAAVLGSTSLTESSSDIALANNLLPRLNSNSLGDALLQAQQAVANELPGAKDVILGGALLGDPALK